MALAYLTTHAYIQVNTVTVVMLRLHFINCFLYSIAYQFIIVDILFVGFIYLHFILNLMLSVTILNIAQPSLFSNVILNFNK